MVVGKDKSFGRSANRGSSRDFCRVGMQRLRATIDGRDREMVILSPREREVLHYLTHGCANKEIAARLGISESTVKEYVTTLLSGLGLGNRVRLSIWGTLNPDFVKGHASSAPIHSQACLCGAAHCSFVHGLLNPA